MEVDFSFLYLMVVFPRLQYEPNEITSRGMSRGMVGVFQYFFLLVNPRYISVVLPPVSLFSDNI